MVSYHKAGIRRCRLMLLCLHGVSQREVFVFAPDDSGRYRKRPDKIPDGLWFP